MASLIRSALAVTAVLAITASCGSDGEVSTNDIASDP
ncbi:MAG: hypothetical protein RL550_1593, partial [Actinomycetota bacterium]